MPQACMAPLKCGWIPHQTLKLGVCCGAAIGRYGLRHSKAGVVRQGEGEGDPPPAAASRGCAAALPCFRPPPLQCTAC